MSEPTVVEGIAKGSDHYVPRFAVYLGPSEPEPSAQRRLETDVEGARRREEDRIRERTSQTRRDDAASMRPLAGPWGDPPGAMTNDVLSVELTESLSRFSEVRARVLNVYQPGEQRYRYTDVKGGAGPILDYGKTLALLAGYRDDVRPLFEGFVTTLEASFPQDGESSVEVTAVDKRERLRSKRLARPPSFPGITSTQLAAEIVGRAGLTLAAAQREESTDESARIRADQDLVQYLQNVADEAPLELTVLGDTVFARPPGDASPTSVLRYAYRRGLLSFTPTLSSTGISTRVRVIARNPRSGERFDVRSDVDRLRQNGLAPALGTTVLSVVERDGQGGEHEDVITNRHARNQDEAQRLADAIVKRNLDRMLTGTGEVIGDPRIRPGTTLRIEGVGRYDGDYYVTEATHSFGDDGYRTRFSVRRNTMPDKGSPDAAG